MFNSSKAKHVDHDRQAKPNITKSFGNRFKEAFTKAKKASASVKHRGVRHLQDDEVIPSENVWTRERIAQDPSEDDVVMIAPDFEQPLIGSNSELVQDPWDTSDSAEEQICLPKSGEHEPSEKPEPFKGGQVQPETEQSAGASIQDPAHSSDINTNLEDHSHEDLRPSATSHKTIAPGQQLRLVELGEQRDPQTKEEDCLDSELDDDEDVAHCLLNQSEIDLRAHNWTDQERENVVPLNVHSLARFTGIREIDVQDIFEELRDSEPTLERELEATSTHSINSIEQDCTTSGAIGSPCQTAADIKIKTGKNAEANDGPEVEIALDGSVITNRDFGREQAVTLDAASFGRAQSPVVSTRCAADACMYCIEACPPDIEDSDSDSGAGVPISESGYNSETKNSHTTSTSSESTESSEKSSPAIDVSGRALGDGIPPSWSSLQVVKRTQRRIAPCAFDLTHERSDSQSTLVNQRSATPSPLESHFPVVRPLEPRNLVDGKVFIDELELTLRVQQAIKETKEATDREWQSASAAAEQRHENELEDLREEHQAVIDDLQETHQDQMKKVRKSHGEKMRNIRGELGRAKLETKSVEEALDNTSIERDALRNELRDKDAQLERAVAVAQDLQGNHDFQIRQHPVAIAEVDRSQSTEIRSATGPATATSARWKQQITELNATINQLRDDLSQCQEARNCYIEKFERYYQALTSTAEKKSLQDMKEELDERTSQLQECQAAREEELRAHKVDREMFFNQVAIMGASVRRCEQDNKAMELSRKAALDANEENVRLMRRAVTDNEMDAAVWEQYRILQRDHDELRQNARGHEYKMRGKDEEINALKAQILMNELQGPRHQKRIQQLEAEIQQLKFDYETAVQERDVAIHDQDKREPELWKSIRNRSLKEKDEKIAHLERELEAHAANLTPESRPLSTYAGEHDKLATTRQSPPSEAISGNGEATEPDGYTTPLQDYSPRPLFGNQQATRLEDFAAFDHGTPESNTSFF